MNQEEIRQKIRLGLSRTGLTAEEIRVQPDPYSGWRIVVICAGFEGLPQAERKHRTLHDLPDLKVQWLDVLTPDERAGAGALPLEVEPEQLPLWPQSLARGRLGTGQAVFPSEIDEDLEPPIVTTFYSLRGGVGRSTALAYTAYLLADQGKRVVCVDLDLEAPGLAALFGKEDEVEEGQGVVRLLLELEQGGQPDISRHLLRVSESYELYCLPAGMPDADYARQLSLLEPDAWYQEDRNPLRILLELLAKGLPFRPDVILLDARTGISRISAPLLFDLADLAFIVFFPHPQARKGTAALVRALLAARTRRSEQVHPLAPEPRFVVSPIPSSKVPEIVQRYRHRAAEWIHEWLSPPQSGQDSRWTEGEITHFIPYQEVLATSDRALADPDLWKNYRPLADWVLRFLPTQKEAQAITVADTKSTVLSELKFPTGTAEDQNNLPETFVETELVSRALRPNVPLVIGRKGTGKTAIFRWLAEQEPARSIVVLAPVKLHKDWQLSADGFKAAEQMLQEKGLEWRELWAAYVCMCCHLQWTSPGQGDSLVPEALRPVLGAQPVTELELLERIKNVLTLSNGTLLVGEWLRRLDKAAGSERLLLVDGLDSGFGNSSADRERRTRAVEGLFTFLTDQGDRLKNLRLKIMLREDIWRKLRFDNKSHLYGRSVRLAWDSQKDYLSIALHQALRSKAFSKLVSTEDVERLSRRPVSDSESVYRVWNLLVGERMKGGNAAYTSNWVWNRLADANDDRGPRALLQLFQSATDWEREEHRRSPYDKSILRPRALMASLDSVAEESLGALLEEFSELQPLRRRLEELGRTPVWARDLEDLKDEVALAREVGLLSVYEGTDSEPVRYRVPDIYRIGLNMTRMGQL